MLDGTLRIGLPPFPMWVGTFVGHVVSVMYRFKAKRVFAEKAGIWINHVADAFEETFISYMYLYIILYFT